MEFHVGFLTCRHIYTLNFYSRVLVSALSTWPFHSQLEAWLKWQVAIYIAGHLCTACGNLLLVGVFFTSACQSSAGKMVY